MMCLLHAVLSIGFEQLQYTFAEGTSKQMCVLIDGYVEISIFQADLSFVPGTAGELCSHDLFQNTSYYIVHQL